MNKSSGNSARWLLGVAMGALFSGGALAQDSGEGVFEESVEVDEVVAVGIKQAIKRAEDIKLNSDSFVDSITATDIGAFPDKSIAEALQRVPGVTVVRTASPTDVTHYSAEPSGVIIRGLTQTRSEFNGRDAFSATSGNGLQYEDISPVLLSRVDTFKNQTAEMIEGGIAGTVNLVTRLPFDETGELASANFGLNYGDIRGEITPEFSGIYSNRWETPAGEFGLLVSGAHSELLSTSRGAVQARTVLFDAGTYSDQENYIPSGVFYTETDYDRVRDGVSFAGQWESNDGRFLATAQYNSTKYENTWRERLQENYWKFIPQGTPHDETFNDPTFILPPDASGLGFNEAGGGVPFTFQDNGLFGMGTINQTFGGAGDWGYGALDWNVDWANEAGPTRYVDGSTDSLGVLSNGLPLYEPCLNTEYSHANQPCPRAVEVLTKTRFADERRSIDDWAFNFKWTPSESLRLNLDYQHVKAETDLYDIVAGFRTFADVNLDLTSGLPVSSWSAPSYYNTEGADIFADPRNYAMANIMDHVTDSVGELNAVRFDAAYDVNKPWIEDVRVGVRYAKRSQEHKWSLYNWNTVSGAWNTPNAADSFQLASGATFNDDGSLRFPGYEQGYWEAVNFGQDILGGGLVGNTPLLFMNFNRLEDRDFMARNFSANGQVAAGGEASAYWNPICDREGEIEGSCFLPGEITDVSEESKAIYGMVRFGGDEASLFGLPARGNIGLRYVETEVESFGSVNFEEPFQDASLDCVDLTQEQIDNLVANGQLPVSLQCLNAASLDDQAFSDGGSVSSTVSTTHKNWLPSLNMRLEVADKTYLRFAASKAISKPDIGLLKNYTVVDRIGIAQGEIVPGNQNLVFDSDGNAVSLNYNYSARTSNPRLKPIKATQFDLAIEHYFEDVGSITATAFYKSFDDYIQNGTFVLPYTNNGVTRDVTVTAPVNGDGAKIKGVELQGLRYLDMLPGLLGGLGVQVNYTYLDNDGVTNSNLVVDNIGDGAVAFSSLDGMINPGRLENLSKHSGNIVGLFEKGKVGARLAYNWRSKYLLSVNDCCVGFPVWAESEGFLDGSIRYAVTDNVELSLQASNLTKTRAEVLSQIKGPTAANPNQEEVFLPATTFEYDRRIQFGVRAKF